MRRGLGFFYPKWSKVPARYYMTTLVAWPPSLRGGLFFEQGAGRFEKLRSLPFKKLAKALGL
jgi:hypothetical protein